MSIDQHSIEHLPYTRHCTRLLSILEYIFIIFNDKMWSKSSWDSSAIKSHCCQIEDILTQNISRLCHIRFHRTAVQGYQEPKKKKKGMTLIDSRYSCFHTGSWIQTSTNTMKYSQICELVFQTHLSYFPMDFFWGC